MCHIPVMTKHMWKPAREEADSGPQFQFTALFLLLWVSGETAHGGRIGLLIP